MVQELSNPHIPKQLTLIVLFFKPCVVLDPLLSLIAKGLQLEPHRQVVSGSGCRIFISTLWNSSRNLKNKKYPPYLNRTSYTFKDYYTLSSVSISLAWLWNELSQ